jgi:hypothetical protein
MTADERCQVFANALKLFTDESAEAVKTLATLGVLPDKLSFGPEGYVIFSGLNDPSTWHHVHSRRQSRSSLGTANRIPSCHVVPGTL